MLRSANIMLRRVWKGNGTKLMNNTFRMGAKGKERSDETYMHKHRLRFACWQTNTQLISIEWYSTATYHLSAYFKWCWGLCNAELHSELHMSKLTKGAWKTGTYCCAFTKVFNCIIWIWVVDISPDGEPFLWRIRWDCDVLTKSKYTAGFFS